MRAVDYVTHGFGGVYEDIIANMTANIARAEKEYIASMTPQQRAYASRPSIPPRAFAPPPLSDSSVRQAFINENFPAQVAEAGLQTYKSRGVAGIDQTINFFNGFYEAMNAYQNTGMWPTIRERLGYQKAITTVFNQLFNTAAARFGTNPLSISIRDALMKSVQNGDPKGILFSLGYVIASLGTIRNRLAR